MSTRTYLFEREDLGGRDPSQRGTRHRGSGRFIGVLDDRESAYLLDVQEPFAAVTAVTGQEDAYRVEPPVLSHRFEEDVDRGAAEGHLVVGRQSKMPVLHQQVVVRGGEVDVSALERLFVLGLGDLEARCSGHHLHEGFAVGFRWRAVLRDHHRQREVRRQRAEYLAQCRHPTHGASDGNDWARHQAILL